MLTFPTIDPVALAIGPVTIRWYALAYLAGFIGGWRIALRLVDRTPAHIERAPTRTDIDDFLTWSIIGVILGGRLGYVLLYNFSYYMAHPAEILQIWHGGMAFHGGMLGMIAAFFIFCRIRNINWLAFGDIIAVVAPLGLGLGRLANFVNGELYGRISDGEWAMVFPGDPNPRHPSQLYQAALEGFLLFAIMLLVSRPRAFRGRPGFVGGVFLLGYAILLSIGELYRSPDIQLGFIIGDVTMGQLLCIPTGLAGLYLIVRAAKMRIPPLAPAAPVVAAEEKPKDDAEA